ncbi:MAG TPA: LapA family protein [Thermosynechococcaceae cyanobacterium]|jgi:uncharacterized integral membrane protein
MKFLSSLLTSVLVAGWIGTIAVVAIQNFTPVSLRFLNWQSIEVPIGLVLAFSVGLGLVGAALVQPVLSSGGADEED